MSSRKIKVLIIDDSLLFRNVLKQELSKDPHIDVVGMAVDPIDAEDKIKDLKPDIITLDVEMPRMNGITFLKKLMRENPIKVVLVSSLNISVFDALDAGAVDFVKKPDMSSKNELTNFYFELSGKIKIAHIAKLKIRAVENVGTGTGSEAGSFASTETNLSSKLGVNTNIGSNLSSTTVSNVQSTIAKSPILSILNLGSLSSQQVIAIGASTGGTEATLEILKKLPKEVPGILVTQHMPPGFTKMYADRLNKLCQMEVREAVNGDRLTAGLALVAPGDKQMRLAKDAKGYFVRCLGEDKVSGHCPSVDVLFESVSNTAGANAIGIILTGMGKDGAEGMLKMKQKGAYTIGQDQASCVVYGMPKVAYDIGGVQIQSPVTEIANILIKQLNKK